MDRRRSYLSSKWNWCSPAPTTILFISSRSIKEAVFGFLPKHVDESLWNVIVYNAFPVECKFDQYGAIKSTWANVTYYIRNFLVWVCVLGMYSSLLLVGGDYKLYPTEEETGLADAFDNVLSWHQLANNFSIASEYNKWEVLSFAFDMFSAHHSRIMDTFYF